MKLKNIKERPWQDIEIGLRQTCLLGDRSVLPYKNAEITSQIVEPEKIAPLANYVVRDFLTFQRNLHREFFVSNKIDTLDLNGSRGGLRFGVEGEKGEWLMVPPIVEVSHADGDVPVLVDGEHRFMLARELGQKIRVIWIEGVPEALPVIAKPIKWDEVRLVEEIPKIEDKREFRFKSPKEYPNLTEYTKIAITDKNFRYFLYRDYSQVASSGVR